MPDLTQDELTVLLIAAEGESMMPIGRWEAPVASLVAKGYLHSNDKFNNFITDAGRKAAEAQDNANIRELTETYYTVERSHEAARSRAEELANLLAELATYSSTITGDDKVKALREWARTILTRALEMVK
jgi:hypothetical protein